ncbi:hypothetical protein BRC19_01075 [Candidatus Saccharibacteria bacterium QS_5_54_17]|nr:MAG: hypothetical protein BRC19_01075 [Candidatus Saccharibacteria bacterium QS_5_54_17]
MQILAIAIATWFGAHALKFSIQAFRGRPDFRWFYYSGGMPSGHAAVVTAVTTGVLMLEGFDSLLFGVAAVFSVIIIFDALGVRRSNGEQAIAINALGASVGNTQPIREVLGHTPREVTAGIGFGALTGLLLTFPAWSSSPQAGWLAAPPVDVEQLVYLVIFAGLVLGGLVVRLVLSRYKSVPIKRRIISQIWWWLVLPGAVGLLFSLLQHQTVTAGSWRIWAIIVVIVTILAQVRLYLRLYRGAPAAYQQQVADRQQRRKQQRKKQKGTRSKKSRKRK